jgi:hypothetical protein
MNKNIKEKGMKRILIVGTIAVLFVMMVTALSGANTGFNLFMNTSIEHIIARAVLIVSLLAVALTVRPRAHMFRAAIGLVSLAIIIFTVSQTVTYSLGLFDSLVYFLSGLILSIEALEAEEPAAEHTLSHHNLVRL